MMNIKCCVVDDHCDILPFLHAFYRAHKLSSSDNDIFLLHVDAHPDLSIPSGSECLKIEELDDVDYLYDLLSEPSGISEFIIPLFTKKLLKQMIWLRSPWSDQLPDGYHSFNIGDTNTRPKVNWKVPYYLDDDCFQNALVPHSTIPLTTCTANTKLCWQSSFLKIHEEDLGEEVSCSKTNRRLWILDICLDYFSTVNPFREDFLSHLIADIRCNSLSNDYLQVLCEIWKLLPFRYADTLFTKSECFSRLMRLKMDYSEFNKQRFTELFNIDGSRDMKVVQTVVDDIIPALSPDTLQYFVDNGHLLLLPHHPIHDAEVVTQKIAELEKFLKMFIELFMFEESSTSSSLPLFITMARSAADGYTPEDQVDFLQNAVLEMLEGLFNSVALFHSPSQVIKVECHDMSDDPVAGAYELLLPKLYRNKRITRDNAFKSDDESEAKRNKKNC